MTKHIELLRIISSGYRQLLAKGCFYPFILIFSPHLNIIGQAFTLYGSLLAVYSILIGLLMKKEQINQKMSKTTFYKLVIE